VEVNTRIWDERSALERLTRILPGFRGYHVREHRRETDALFRRFGLHRLDQVRASRKPDASCAGPSARRTGASHAGSRSSARDSRHALRSASSTSSR
jgi:hypothetical protein